MSPLFMRGCR